MKNIIPIIAFLLVSISVLAQGSNAYIKNLEELKGKHTIYTEIIIDASPDVVRAKFLEFEKWPEWNYMIPKVAVKTGNIDSIETKPTLMMTLNFSRKKDPSPAPVFPEVYANNEGVFVWGFDLWYLRANHVHIFEPIDNGTKTRFINYEEMNGLLKSFIMTKKTKSNMTNHFIEMNKSLKSICE